MRELRNEGRDWISDLRSEFTILFAYSQIFEEEEERESVAVPALFPSLPISHLSLGFFDQPLYHSRPCAQILDSSLPLL